MSEALEGLLQCRPVKAFAKLFQDLEKEWSEPAEFVRQAAPYLGPRLYHPYYDDDTPHSLFGLATSLELAPLCPPEQVWWPFVQHAWYAANSRRRSPLPWAELEAAGSGSSEERWTEFETALKQPGFESAFSLARGLFEHDPEFLQDRLLHHALHDSAQGGLEFLFVSQYLRLMELVEGEAGLSLLAPIVHLMVYGPRDCELAAEVERYTGSGASAGGAAGRLDAAAYGALQEGVLFGDELDDALQAADRVTVAGLDGLWDGLMLAGINAVCNARAGHWIWPTRAVLVAYEARRRFASADPADHRMVALYAAALLHRASLRSRHSKSNRDLEEVARQLCPLDTFNALRSLVSHSDPFASATAVYAILGMGDERREELFQSLATLAAKNDGRMGRGYDLLLVKAAVDSYRASQLDEKDRFLSGCAFFLGRLKKDYELFGAYGP